MDEGLEKYRHWQEHLEAAQKDLKASLRMVDTIQEVVSSPDAMRSSPVLCADIQDLAGRLRFFITSRLTALEDLVVLLDKHGIHARFPEE